MTLVITLITSTSSYAFEYSLLNKELTQEEQTSAKTLIEDASSRLPEVIKNEIKLAVNVEFIGSADSEIIMSCGDGKVKNATQFLGQTTNILGRKKIQINRAFLKYYNSNPTAVTHDCKHKNISSEALATLLHETMHFYEFILTSNGKKTLSSSKVFKSHTFNLKNELAIRSVDAYEFTSLTESIAVNFEYFLLDPEYKCRQPLLYNYYATELKHTPFPDEQCESSSSFKMNHNASILTINPDQIYRIDYLLAGKGKALMSRFGHSMIRIVMCAPGRKMGPECLQDISKHIILTYRANTGNSATNYIKGLNGTYPSQLFVLPFSNVLEEYNKDELRDLFSYPLILTKEQKENFLKKALLTHWSYSGKYYFVSNNCAAETSDLIQSILPEDHPFRELSPTMPYGLRDALVKNNLIKDFDIKDAKALNDQYFPTTFSKDLELAFNNVKTNINSEKVLKNYEDYIVNTTSTERLEWFNKDKSNKKVKMSFFLLEKIISKKYNEKVTAALNKLIKDNAINTADMETINEQLKKEGSLSPWSMIKVHSYGLPLIGEIDAEASLASFFDYNTGNKNLVSVLKIYNPDFVSDYELNLLNLKTFFH